MRTSEEFWTEKHVANSHYWLTGSSLASISTLYGQAVPSAQDVTEVGVGFGTVTQALHQLGNRVTAVDIVPEALTRVREVSTAQVLVADLAKATPADWALAHLVFQHCDVSMLAYIIHTLPLKAGGTFLCQTARLLRGSPALDAAAKDGRLFWHAPDLVADLMIGTGLQVEHTKGADYEFDGAAVGWDLFVARKP